MSDDESPTNVAKSQRNFLSSLGKFNPGFAMNKATIRAHSAAYSVSQYFKMGNTEIALRTSGYSKFGDQEIPQAVLDGTATVDITGVLTMYQGTIQLVVNSLDDIVVNY